MPAEGWLLVDESKALSLIQRRLKPGETLIWHGAPNPWRAAQGPLFQLVFAAIWTGVIFITVVGYAISSSKKSSLVFPVSSLVIFGLLFCFIGTAIWISTLRNLVACWNTAYGLTNHRLVIAIGDKGKTESFSKDSLSSLLRSGDDKQGTLRFDYGRKGRGYGYRNGLYGIKDPARVEALIYQHLIAPKSEGTIA
jgi:hypothetical protein